MTVDLTRRPGFRLDDAALRGLDQAEEYVAGICFKTGPPALLGIELLSASQGVDFDGLPEADRVTEALRSIGHAVPAEA